MRILAIRGANLASLADGFELDLAAAPLATAGLFAITGATGAGKSTLLDAMCAALFDRTPRLEGHSRHKLDDRGGKEVGAFDVRTLLRRTATRGWAEVDFEGRDHHRYRARWEVRRARDRADGALRDQARSLVRLSDQQRLGGTRREIQAAIDDALGLTFDQFRRSALLAQGEFAAFLRADPGDRAELLERVTGTALYGELSKAAHRRAGELAAHRRALVAVRDATAVLDDEARAAATSAATAADVALGEARRREAALIDANRWRGHRAAVAVELAAAAARWAAAVADLDAAAPLADRLARHERAAPLASAWTAAHRAAAQAEASAEAARAAATTAAAARVDAERADRAAELARQTRDRAGADQAAAAAALAEAARADQRVGELERAAAAAARHAEAARLRAADHAAQRQRAEADRTRADTALAAAHAELAREPRAAAVAERWPALAAALTAADQAATALAVARARLDQLVPAQATADTAAAAAAALVEQAAADLHIARQRDDLTQAAAAAAPTAPAQLALERAERAHLAWLALDELAGGARGRRRARAERAASAAAATAAAEAAAAASVASRAEQRAAADRADEARAALERLRAALGLDGLRAQLVDGEPCPLCGAAEHPWGHDVVLDGLVAEQAARVDQLDRAVADHRDEAERHAVAAAEHRGRAAAAGDEADRLELALTEDGARWRAGVAALGQLALHARPDGDDAAAWVRDGLAAATAALAAAAAARAAAEARATAARDSHAAVLAAHHAHELARADATRAATDAASLAAEQAALARARDSAGAARARAEDEARGLLGAGVTLDDPAGLRDELAAAVGRWRAASARADAADRARAAAAAAAAALAPLSEALIAAEGAAVAEAATAATAAAEARAHRAGLLGGAATAEVEAGLAAAVAAATAAAEAAAVTARDADRARAAAQAAATAAEARAREAAATAAEARARLAEGLAEAQLDEATVAEALAWPAGAAAQARATLRALADGQVAAEARLVELRRQAAQLDGERPAAVTDEDDDGWAARMARARAATDAAAAAAAAAAARVAADRAGREQRAAHDAALAVHDREAAPFAQLDELIGSADGKKLRQFAQSLTLAALLRAANHHLDELAPRYQLERVPRADLELQVIDRDMGDEIRSLASLSGGETFLASLALALGLSSLSAGGATVRTLLVDEGFGTLDPHTLDTALAALDALRASGRQVGIVSHVPGFDERVGATVEVRPVGGGKSVVTIHGPR